MNYIEIDKLKNIFSDLQKAQNTIRSIDFGVEGKIIAVGYNPYWTSRFDSKIVKLELNFLGKNGIMVPLTLKDIVDYNIYPNPKEGRRSKKYKVTRIELIVLSPGTGPNLSNDKVQFEIIYDD